MFLNLAPIVIILFFSKDTKMVIIKGPDATKLKRTLTQNPMGGILKSAQQEADAGTNTCIQGMQSHPPQPGQQYKCAFITWSSTSTGRWISPNTSTKKFFANRIGLAWDTISNPRTPTPSIMVVEEPHASGDKHMHAIVKVDNKVQIWHKLGDALRDQRIICHVTCSSNPKAADNMMRYVLCPSREKLETDIEPYLTPSFVIPEHITRSIEKSRSAILRRPADAEEVKNFIFDKKTIETFKEFTLHIDQMHQQNPTSVFFSRMSQFISKNRDARSIVELSSLRMKALFQTDESLMDMLRESISSKCTCVDTDHLYHQMIKSLTFHDNHEPSRNSSAVIGEYYNQLFTDSFTNRKQSLYLFGVPSSGKSTVSQMVLNVVNPKRIFLPDYGSNFPFSNIQTTDCLSSLNEFRASAKHSSSQWLLFLERSPLYVDRKGKPSEYIEKPPPSIITSNIISPNAAWTAQDIQALNERCIVVTWVHPLPTEIVDQAKSSTLHSRCKKCSSRVILWASPGLRSHFPNHSVEQHQPVQGPVYNDQQLMYLMPMR